MTQLQIDDKCRAIYQEANAFFADKKLQYGFKILNGPPLHRTPVMFVGYQPGGGADDAKEELSRQTHLRWPEICEHSTAKWKLARQLQTMFGKDWLAQCVGVNAIFVRAPSIGDYKRDIRRETRAQIAEFCQARLIRLIDLIEPKKVVAIGFSTLRLFGPIRTANIGDNGRRLTCAGRIGDHETLATLHLSGARISTADRDKLREWISA